MSKKETMSNWGSDERSVSTDEKIAAIFYYYLSLTQDSAEEKAARLQELFDVGKSVESYLNTLGLLDQGETVPEDDDEVDRFLRLKLAKTEVLEHFCIAFDKFAEVKDEVIRVCEETLAAFPADERYELIVDEIDRLRAEVDFDNREYLWAFVFATVAKGGLSDTQRKFLRHFCRIADIDKDVLSAMEDVAKKFVAIGKNRKDAKTGTRPYAEVVAELAALDAEEAVAHKTLSTLLGLDSSEAENDGAGFDEGTNIFGPAPPSPLEQIGDGIGEIIEGVADGVCDVIEGVTDGVCDILDGISDGLWEFAAKH